MKDKLFKKLAFNITAAGLILLNLATTLAATENREKQPPHSAFIVKQNGTVIKSIGPINERHAPFSTFKVALSLMGFDAGILQSKDKPKWTFKEEYEKNFQSWYTRDKGLEYNWCQDHTPATFMKNSVVWFSHQITQRLGAGKFQSYVSTLNYGNSDVSGTPGKDDGLCNSWLGTSLEISVREQVEFLEKLLANDLSISKDAQEKTKEIMDREEEWDGWKLYGKTGGGSHRNGWFIGWIEKGQHRIVFAQYLDLEDSGINLTGLPAHKSVGLTAKEIIKREILPYLKEISS